MIQCAGMLLITRADLQENVKAPVFHGIRLKELKNNDEILRLINNKQRL
jgi:hypothetical protein